MIRQSICAGTWYPKSKDGIEKFLDLKAKPMETVAAVCPHAGWLYSGKTAGKVYSRLPKADTFILVGPNHSGSGSPFSIFFEGEWNMPLGPVRADNKSAKIILQNSEFLQEDYKAHMREHSLEVQIPFIQYFNPGAEIVPITIMSDTSEICADIGRSVAAAVKQEKNKKFMIVASSDMSHYEPKKFAKKNDSEAIDRMIALDPAGLLEIVSHLGISMCGAGPVATVMYAARELGAKESRLIDYSTSGDVTGDDESVVSYAGLIMY